MKNRKGHVDAFRKSGVMIDAHAFEGIYKNATKIDGKNVKYEQDPISNAVSLVGYYRKGMAPRTGLIGFGEVDIVSGKEYKADASKDKDVYNKFIDILTKTSEFEAQFARVNTALESLNIGLQLDADQMKQLVKDHTLEVNGVKIDLPATFEKVLNGPCANEAYMLTFGEMTVSYKRPEGDISVGVEYTSNYQTVKTFSVGIGFMGGKESSSSKKNVTKEKRDEDHHEDNPKEPGGTTVLDGPTDINPTNNDANGGTTTTETNTETEGSGTGR